MVGTYSGCCVFGGDFLHEGGKCEGWEGVHWNALENVDPVTPQTGLESDRGLRYAAVNVVSDPPARCCRPGSVFLQYTEFIFTPPADHFTVISTLIVY